MSEATALRTLIYALRHAPQEFHLMPDAAGWVSVLDLLLSVRVNRPTCSKFTAVELASFLASDADRVEVRDGLVRARYGFSVFRADAGPPAVPPAYLFHGLPLSSLADVLRDGLRPMGRQFVHLTTDREYAKRVADNRGPGTLLRVSAVDAHAAGVRFIPVGSHVWLAEPVPPRFLLPTGLSNAVEVPPSG